jgi:hypothetical protein
MDSSDPTRPRVWFDLRSARLLSSKRADRASEAFGESLWGTTDRHETNSAGLIRAQEVSEANVPVLQQ